MTFDYKQQAYIALRNIVSERTANVVAWVGSGLSVPAGLPTWSGLRKSLETALKNKADTFGEEDRKQLLVALESIIKEKNNWVAFQMLQEELGATTYRETIKSEFICASSAEVPEALNYLWKMRIKGILTLNIDRIASRAYSNTSPGRFVHEISGFECGRQLDVMKSPSPFIANLHGDIDDHSSWVFTHGQLAALFANEGYSTFIKTCLASNVVVFIGISADDIAAGGHLEKLIKLGINAGTHYWITSRRDRETDRWAESVGIRVIRYAADKQDHSVLIEIFKDMLTYVPKEAATNRPILFAGTDHQDTREELPTPEELARMPANDIRIALNRHAKTLIHGDDDTVPQEYIDFCEKYDEAVYRSWYTSDSLGSNKLFDYTLSSFIKRGAFGKVFKAVDNNGTEYAIKVLHEEIRTKKELLTSFRRGVRSMQILSHHGISGMVKCVNASEIPAFVVMEWIEGIDLDTAVKSRAVNDWGSIIATGIQLTKIIRAAHALPERVLHRDIRPSNIMLHRYYTTAEIDVVVLDFDLSWHRGACEQSVIYGSSSLGYLAPEQIQEIPKVSTRHASVDSFGIGMTLYYMCSGNDPLPDQHRHVNWHDEVAAATSRHRSITWKSLPRRFARLIVAATEDKQQKRYDVGQIQLELERLFACVIDYQSVQSSELIAEEIMARSQYSKHYKWDNDMLAACIDLPTGVSILIKSDDSSRSIILKIIWTKQDFQDRRGSYKYVMPAVEKAKSKLTAAGWSCNLSNITPHNVALVYEIPALAAICNIDRIAESVGGIASDLTLN